MKTMIDSIAGGVELIVELFKEGERHTVRVLIELTDESKIEIYSYPGIKEEETARLIYNQVRAKYKMD
jgi:hypothetical protein